VDTRHTVFDRDPCSNSKPLSPLPVMIFFLLSLHAQHAPLGGSSWLSACHRLTAETERSARRVLALRPGSRNTFTRYAAPAAAMSV
jgi:hypothetical protein